MTRHEREAELVETYRVVQGAGLPHVLVGGWAVSAFHRLTSDDFEDSFKGVFQQASVPEPDVDRVVAYLRRVAAEL